MVGVSVFATPFVVLPPAAAPTAAADAPSVVVNDKLLAEREGVRGRSEEETKPVAGVFVVDTMNGRGPVAASTRSCAYKRMG